jgi:uncharacterized protein YecT (DUF1311 family)
MKFPTLLALLLAPALALADTKGELEKVELKLRAQQAAPGSETTLATKLHLREAISAADEILNRVYQKHVARLKKKGSDEYLNQQNEEILNRLVKAQRAWIAFKEANSILHGSEMLGGTGEGIIVSSSIYEMTKDRASELEAIFAAR